MKPYQHGNGRVVARGHGGRFRRWDLDSDFGVTVCPWCRHFATRPAEATTGPFIDPRDMSQRTCLHCGWDSDRGSVDVGDLHRALERLRAAYYDQLAAEAAGDSEAADILGAQARREHRRALELAWLKPLPSP